MKKVKEKAKKVLNSYQSILILLIAICLVSMFINYRVMHLSNTFMFNGANDYVRILNGVISNNYDVNLFVGSDIEYLKENDIEITNYKIGYYTMQNDKFIKLAVMEGSDEIGLSLKKLLSSNSSFNVTEPTINKYFITSDTIKALKEDKLYFIIDVIKKDGTSLKETLKIDVEMISK